jgi:Tol biopolymer transport system component
MRTLVVLALAGCGEVQKLPIDGAIDTAVPDDGGLGAFGTPMRIAELVSPDSDDDPTVTNDQLELFFDSARPGGLGQGDVWVARRLATSDPFAEPTVVVELRSAADDTTPEISPDGLTLYFASDRETPGDRDIYVSTRQNRSGLWSPPTRLVELSSPQTDDNPIVSADGLTIYFASTRAGSADIYKATRMSRTQPFGPSALVGGLSEAGSDENQHWISPDERTIYFTSTIPEQGGILLATRQGPDDAFGPATEVPGINSMFAEHDPWLSMDQRVIVFTSNRQDGNEDLYIATR